MTCNIIYYYMTINVYFKRHIPALGEGLNCFSTRLSTITSSFPLFDSSPVMVILTV